MKGLEALHLGIRPRYPYYNKNPLRHECYLPLPPVVHHLDLKAPLSKNKELIELRAANKASEPA